MISLMYSSYELEQKVEKTKESIRHLERTRFHLYKELVDLLSWVDQDILPSDRLPKCKVEIHDIGSPLVQLSYDGMLPMYDSKDTKYKNEIRDYYIESTLRGFNWREIGIRFPNAFMYIIHSFHDLRIRDLDNRNRKVLIDAVRRTSILHGDDWKNLTIMEKGIKSAGENRVDVFIGDEEKMIGILKYVNEKFSLK